MKWEKAACRMLNALNLDLYNHRMMADPWRRAVHCMLQSWRIQASQSRSRVTKPAEPCHDWNQAVRRMKASLEARMKEQATRGTWGHWAAHRPHPSLRYVSKAQRERTANG